MADTMLYHLDVRFRKKEQQVTVATADPTCEQIASAIALATGAERETIKLTVPGKPGTLINLSAHTAQHASEIGLKAGAAVMMYASTAAEVQQVRSSKDLPGLAGFQQELKQQMRRQRGSSAGTLTLPTGPYTFQGFEAWQRGGLTPSPQEALKLLHRLAADPGIVGIMTKHRWPVGLLSEMPPEGKVGVSPVCILGVNINRGQEISLRLRTDDLNGFRRYDKIRETLCHELAHMVWGEHDNRFKELNSQLLKECSQLDWTSQAGHALQAFEDPAAATWVDEDDIMAVTSQSSGQTLRQLTAGEQNQSSARAGQAVEPRRAAAMAASSRLIAAGSPIGSRSASPDAGHTATPIALATAPDSEIFRAGANDPRMLGQGAVAGGAPPLQAGAASGHSAVPEGQVAVDPAADIACLGHRDASTEQAEEAMRQLGSTDFASAAQQRQAMQDQPDLQRQPDLQHQSDLRNQGNQHLLSDPQIQGLPDLQHQQPRSDQPSQHLHDPANQPTQLRQQMQGLPDQQEHQSQPDQGKPQLPGQPDQNFRRPQGEQPSSPQPAPSSSLGAQSNMHAPQSSVTEVVNQPAEAMEVDADDPAVLRYRQAEAAVARLQSQAGAGQQQLALQTLLKVLQNIVSHPGDAKYKHIRLGNAAFHSRAGQFTAAKDILSVAGFTEEAAGAVDRVLVWKRHDQGLLWLTLSAVQNALHQAT